MSESPASVLAAFAPPAGLREALEPFPRAGGLGERLRARPLLMAPMAGVSDAAYRMMARAGGASLAYSEMVSVAGLHYGGAKTWELALPREGEPDLAVQLFGSDPAQFEEAARAVSRRLGDKLALIDLNMACPVPKVTKGGAGSALLDDVARACEIVRACRRGIEDGGSSVALTAKIRRGRRMGEEQAPEFARALADAGVSAIAVHGRFANQLYRGEADWGVVARVVEAVDVPVIGSGDVFAPEDAARLRQETGCAAVMVARGSYGNPWLFSGTTPSAEQRLAAFECHVRLLQATGAHLARARSLAGWYFKGMPNAAHLRGEAMSCDSVEDYLGLARRLRRG